MKVKRGLLYTASHEWVDFMPDGTARVGISDFVPQKRGKISFLNLCDEGEYYQSGEVIGDAEAFKGVAAFFIARAVRRALPTFAER